MKEKKQWVCHISGQGEKWEVEFEQPHEWAVTATSAQRSMHYLPKSEYRLCDPPEVWRDVTGDVKLGCEPSCLLYDSLGRNLAISNGYRIRKVTLYAMARPIIDPMQRQVAAFIVEQKVPA